MFVCMCIAVTDDEIRDCVRTGARTVEEVGDRSMAGTGCGNCHEHIQMILTEGGGASASAWCALSRTA